MHPHPAQHNLLLIISCYMAGGTLGTGLIIAVARLERIYRALRFIGVPCCRFACRVWAFVQPIYQAWQATHPEPAQPAQISSPQTQPNEQRKTTMSFDLMSQLFGSQKGHQVNTTIDTLGGVLAKEGTATVLQAAGLPTTTSGVISLAEQVIDSGIASSGLSDTEKALAEGVIGSLIAGLTNQAPASPAPAAPATVQAAPANPQQTAADPSAEAKAE